MSIQPTDFSQIGICPALNSELEKLNWNSPTEIQKQVIPSVLEGRDIIGLAETGSGKTGAFAIPILNKLLDCGSRLFALVLSPTRELSFQINDVFEALGSGMGLLTTCIVGGIEMVEQAIILAKRPHVIIATPGRLLDHLHNTKGFNLRSLKMLVIDEADRMLSMDFEKEISDIISLIPSERQTLLFSATMTSKVEKLQKASLLNPIRIEVSLKFQTPKSLVQQYVFVPAKWKDCYLVFLANEFKGQSIIIFVSTCNSVQRISYLLKLLGFETSPLHGQLSQPKRLNALQKFKSGNSNILVATDVASRGLDIPNVDLVVNFDIPSHGKDYIHRVGRTARAGKAGRAVSFVTQYDVEAFQHLESLLGYKLPEFSVEESNVLILLERVTDAQRQAARQLKELDDRKNKRGRKGNNEDSNKRQKTDKEL